MKIVIDTNVIIAAFATRGLCNEVFELCLAEHEIFLSAEIIAEVEKGLLEKIKVPENVVKDIIEFLKSKSENVEIKVETKGIMNEIRLKLRDPKDLIVLSTAELSGAEVILTGDKDLLSLKGFKKIKILAPREFYDLLKKQNSNI